MSSFHEILGVVPGSSSVARAADIVAALTPPAAAPGAIVPANAAPKESVTSKVMKFVPDVAGAAVGYFVGKKYKHPYLGAAAGVIAVQSGMEYKNGDKNLAMCDAAVGATTILGAMYPKTVPYLGKKYGAFGGAVGGLISGLVATYFFAGSRSKALVTKIKSGF